MRPLIHGINRLKVSQKTSYFIQNPFNNIKNSFPKKEKKWQEEKQIYHPTITAGINRVGILFPEHAGTLSIFYFL